MKPDLQAIPRQPVNAGKMFRCTLAMVMSLLVVNAFAWGKDGHQVVANLAAAQLTAKALAEVERLLALEPGETLESISTWADEDRSPLTGPWHYVNFPKSICTYDAERDCPDGNCVVGVIGKQLEILASNASDELRLKALKYFVHLEADVHQPLHAGHGDDRGGNSYQLHAFGHGTNLHAIWDWELIGNINEDPQALTRRLISKGNAATGADLSVAHAAEESCKIVGTPGFYPGRNLRPDYVQRFTPVLEQRLSEAGARLAGLLNRVFR